MGLATFRICWRGGLGRGLVRWDETLQSCLSRGKERKPSLRPRGQLWDAGFSIVPPPSELS